MSATTIQPPVTPTPAPGQGAAPRPPRRSMRLRLDSLPTVAALVILLAMLAYGEIAYGRILQAATLSNLLINNAHVIVLAVGLTFVILTGGIDLSVGAIVAVSSVAGVILANAGWDPWW